MQSMTDHSADIKALEDSEYHLALSVQMMPSLTFCNECPCVTRHEKVAGCGAYRV